MSQWVPKNNAESWWIEYLEGELSPKDQELAETILEKSPVDQLIVNNLSMLRGSLQEADVRWQSQFAVDWAALEQRIFLRLQAKGVETAVAANAKDR